MVELVRSDDAVFVSWLEMRLGELGIKVVVLDTHTSSIYGGALSAVQRRVMVDEADLDRSRRLLADAAAISRDA
jgi:Putative prokaryotic signal transducing protein